MAQIIITISRATVGFILAFQRGFWFSAMLLLAFPILLFQTLIMLKAFTDSYSMNLEAYAKCAGHAEQSMNGVRIV
jgi:hypothetical protein